MNERLTSLDNSNLKVREIVFLFLIQLFTSSLILSLIDTLSERYISLTKNFLMYYLKCIVVIYTYL